ncbi:MAG: PQQ-dependent sugar dehydrogenase [Bacteroidetes bacterium]|nr:MAG: PQQ-dependent sugar dehydrogenase [Bacteroidota bacterium]
MKYCALLLLLSAAMLTSDASCQDIYRSSKHDFTVETIVGGLDHVWSIAFLPDGDMLVTERPGRLRIVRNGELLEGSVSGVPEVHAVGQGGLLDVVPHPDFVSNHLIYLTYSKPLPDSSSTTAVLRGRLENDALLDTQDIFVADTKGRGHYGSRIAFDADGYLFVTVGDRQASPSGDLEAHPAQDISNHHGTVNRLYDDGRIPEDNPFVDDDDAQPEIWSYGHRNQQGIAVHPESGVLWAIEHGPQGGDELNIIKKGLNYGWPVVGYGVNYGSGSAIHEGIKKEGMEGPRHFWVPSIATSGLLIYTGDKFPEWKGDFFVGGLVGTQLARLEVDSDSITGEETLLKGIGRVRDVRQGPDGYIYLAIDNSEGTQSIVRLVPAPRSR